MSLRASGVRSTATPKPSQNDEWTLLVARMQGDPDPLTALYETFGRGVRFLMFRQLGPQDIEDGVHNAFLIVLQAIQRGELRDPALLTGFVRTIVWREVATQINHLNRSARNRRSKCGFRYVAAGSEVSRHGSLARSRSGMDIKRAGQERLLAVVNADPNAVDVTVPGHGDSDSAQSYV